jgi:hypothetical protein
LCISESRINCEGISVWLMLSLVKRFGFGPEMSYCWQVERHSLTCNYKNWFFKIYFYFLFFIFYFCVMFKIFAYSLKHFSFVKSEQSHHFTRLSCLLQGHANLDCFTLNIVVDAAYYLPSNTVTHPRIPESLHQLFRNTIIVTVFLLHFFESVSLWIHIAFKICRVKQLQLHTSMQHMFLFRR